MELNGEFDDGFESLRRPLLEAHSRREHSHPILMQRAWFAACAARLDPTPSPPQPNQPCAVDQKSAAFRPHTLVPCGPPPSFSSSCLEPASVFVRYYRDCYFFLLSC